MPWKRLLYLIPIAVSTATAFLGVLCLLNGIRDMDRYFLGFFYHADGSVAKMQRGGWEGPTAGVRPGDVVEEANGHQLANGMELNQWLQHRRIGEWIRLSMIRPSTGQRREVTLQLRSLSTTDILATFVLPYSIGVVYLLLGVVVFFLTRTYGAALAMSICVVASVFYMTIFDAHTSHTFSRLWISYSLLGAVSVHLFSVFPGIRPWVHRPLVLGIPYLITAGILAFAQWRLFDSRYAIISSFLSSGFLALCFLFDIGLLSVTSHRDPSLAIQNKAKTIRIGLLVTAAAGVVWSLLARFYPELITAERAMMLSGLFPLLLSYAVIKKNLFEVDIFLRTTSIYAIATALVVALYFVVVFIAGLAMSSWTQRFGKTLINVETVVVFTLIVALIFHPLRQRVQQVVDRFFFRAHRETEAAMVALGKDMAAMTQDFSALTSLLCTQVQELMRCRYVFLLSPLPRELGYHLTGKAGALPKEIETLTLTEGSALIEQLRRQPELLPQSDEDDEPIGEEVSSLLQRAEVSMLVPLHTGTSMAGILVLGQRYHGDVFRRFEVQALRGLSVPAALALDNSILLKNYADRERLAALGKFSAIMIHEVKNPLGIIKVSSGTLKKRFAPADSGYELSSFIEEEVDRMNRTIAKFLSFARPSPPQIDRIDLSALVTRMAEAARGDLERTNVTLEVDVVGDVMVLADSEQVQQVLLNLIVNAQQALESLEDARILLALNRRAAAGKPAEVELLIVDNGPGIEPKIQGRIFEPFFTTRRGGTGLGLAIAQQILGEQGGSIRVRSKPGETTFRITLPAA